MATLGLSFFFVRNGPISIVSAEGPVCADEGDWCSPREQNPRPRVVNMSEKVDQVRVRGGEIFLENSP